MNSYLIVSGLIYLAGFVIWSKDSWANFLVKMGFAVMLIWTVIKYVEVVYKVVL